MIILILTSHESRIDETVKLEVGNEIYDIRVLELGCIDSQNTTRCNGHWGWGKKPITKKACSVSLSSSSSDDYSGQGVTNIGSMKEFNAVFFGNEKSSCDNRVGEESKNQQLWEEEMIGVNSGPKTWAYVVAKICLGCETLEEHQDRVEGSVSKEDMLDPSNNDPPLTHRESVHIASVLNLGDAADESGLTPSLVESIDKLNRTHNQSLDPEKTLIMSDDSDKSGSRGFSTLRGII
ncbi:hypothetical protein V6N13_149566 [Hibiscus sabdariffa]|uniref:Uncharacterized protein n=1 Tax=Hibiscus sabdariffa TaxID=183260 RepID=A0ABR2EGZ0_9ROSI